MKRFLPLLLLICGSFFSQSAFTQKDWSLVKDEKWIRIYKSDMHSSGYKRVKVECVIDGTFDKLLQVLNNVDNHKNWIYNTKEAHLIKRVNSNEYYYYTETFLPWPMQNRDAIVNIKIFRESNKRLLIMAVGVPDYMSCVSGKVRVPRSANNWEVTIAGPNKLHIVYTFEADPGGSLPSWLVNSFVNKGPYESFKNLAEQLKK